jgi:3-hydroxyisobutyrate dehydrogenase-like beta-hydroxyacid dehydrogenase
MGFPMAGHLARAGHELRVYNRTPDRARRWVEEYGGESFATPAEAVVGARVVFVCSGNDDDVRSVVLGPDGALRAMSAGTCLVDHTTVSAQLARELYAQARSKDVASLDAPVSGGQAGAEAGGLTIMVGGDEAAFLEHEPLLSCYAKKLLHMGPAGSGQLTKCVNQICIAGILQGLSEGLDFAERAGLDPEQVVEVISKGAAQSWQMDNRAQTMIADEFDFGFAVKWMRKDLGIARAEGQRSGARLPLTALVDEFYAELETRGEGRLDTSSLIRLLR